MQLSDAGLYDVYVTFLIWCCQFRIDLWLTFILLLVKVILIENGTFHWFRSIFFIGPIYPLDFFFIPPALSGPFSVFFFHFEPALLFCFGARTVEISFSFYWTVLIHLKSYLLLSARKTDHVRISDHTRSMQILKFLIRSFHVIFHVI